MLLFESWNANGVRLLPSVPILSPTGAETTLELSAMRILQAEVAKMSPIHESSSPIIPSVD